MNHSPSSSILVPHLLQRFYPALDPSADTPIVFFRVLTPQRRFLGSLPIPVHGTLYVPSLYPTCIWRQPHQTERTVPALKEVVHCRLTSFRRKGK